MVELPEGSFGGDLHPAEAVSDERASELLAWWKRKRLGDELPSRRLLDPAEIKPALPSVVLVGVSSAPPHFVYRLLGTREVVARGGRNPVGRPVAEHCVGSSRERTMGLYRWVRDHRNWLWDGEVIRYPESYMIEKGTLFLPWTVAGAGVDIIFVYTVHDGWQP